MIYKETDELDTRSYSIHLSKKGKNLTTEVASFANQLQPAFSEWSIDRKSKFYSELLEIIFRLQKLGFINIQRSCHSCQYFQTQQEGGYCNLLKLPLRPQDLRVDCQEFQAGG